MQFKVVVVSPKYQINVGYIARVSANFGVERVEFVRPRCKILGATAIKYSKGGRGLLEASKTRSSLAEAIGGTFSLATTGIWRKSGSASKGIYTADQTISIIKKAGPEIVSIVLGRDDIGLKPDEIKECSVALFIATNPEYPVLNISHALSILLHALVGSELSLNYGAFRVQDANQSDKDSLSNLFRMYVYGNGNVRDKKTVASAFKSVIDKSFPTKKELKSIAAAFSLKSKTKEKAKREE